MLCICVSILPTHPLELLADSLPVSMIVLDKVMVLGILFYSSLYVFICKTVWLMVGTWLRA